MRWERALSMFRNGLLVAFVCAVLTPTIGRAQNLCPATGTSTGKLICLVPQVFGPNGLVLPAGPAQFQNNFADNSLAPLNSAIARQSIFLPLASPSSGITYSWDPIAKIFSPTTDSFGPIYAERAETIGKYRLFLGVSYQYFAFSSMDGTSLHRLPEVFTQPDVTIDVGNGAEQCSTAGTDTTGSNVGDCAFIRDVVKVNNRIDLKVHQVVAFMTFGLTNRLDVSVAIPLQTIHMSIVSNATIVDNSSSRVHAFLCGQTDCLTQAFSSAGEASGIGDITLRVKGKAFGGERAALAIGADVRVPTGDSLNFLGSGAAGVRPFVVWSYRARVSPHLGAGFEANGSSRVAGDISTGTKERLAGQFTYSAGADVWLNKRVTAAFDLVGQLVLQGQQLKATKFTELGACLQVPCVGPNFATPNVDDNLTATTGSFNVINASVGLKLKLVSNLMFTGNVVFKTNDSGLRAKAIPMGELSYTF
jgi:hypothetical protein